MNFLKEKYEEIKQALEVVVEVTNTHTTELEIRTMARRLVDYHGPELFRIIAALPGERYFPTGWDLETRARIALGLKPKTLTEEMIEANERELVVSGRQSAEQARKGAEFMKRTMQRKPIPPPPPPPEDPFAALEDFGEENKNPLDALGDF